MIIAIEPVVVGRNASGPVSADAINAYTVTDDQVASATWFYQYGKSVTTPAVAAVVNDKGEVTTPAVDAKTSFSGVDGAIGNLVMAGDDYAGWDGSSHAAGAWIAHQLNVVDV
jgi:hypothetical protein